MRYFWFWNCTSRREQNCYFEPFFFRVYVLCECVSKTDNFKFSFDMFNIFKQPLLMWIWDEMLHSTLTAYQNSMILSNRQNNYYLFLQQQQQKMFPLIYKLFFYSSIHSNLNGNRHFPVVFIKVKIIRKILNLLRQSRFKWYLILCI